MQIFNANFSVVFGPNFGGLGKNLLEGKLPQGAPPDPLWKKIRLYEKFSQNLHNFGHFWLSKKRIFDI